MSRLMTIAQILPQLNAGGVERGTLEINSALVAAGHRSIVISGGGAMVEKLEAAGGEHVTMPVWKKSPLTLATVPKMRRWILENKPDVLHVRSRVPAWVTWLAWRKLPTATRPRFIATAHGMNKVNAYSRIMTKGEVVVAVSHTCRDYLLNNYPDTDPNKVEVIHRGVSPEEFPWGYRPTESWLKDWYQQYPQLRDRFVACLPGRITRFKGHHDFLQTLAIVNERGTNMCGVIAGAQDPRRKRYAAELRQRITDLGLSDKVVFTGHRSDIKDVIAACDVSVSTSIQPPESFGRTVLESVRLGKITLGYAHGGVGEVLSTVYPEGRIPLQNIETLANKLQAAARGELSLPKPGEHFLLSTMQAKTLALYERLLQQQISAAAA